MDNRNALLTGYQLEQSRVTWIRWDSVTRRNRVSHPIVWILTEPEGYMRTFNTRRDALAWLAEPGNVEEDGNDNG